MRPACALYVRAHSGDLRAPKCEHAGKLIENVAGKILCLRILLLQQTQRNKVKNNGRWTPPKRINFEIPKISDPKNPQKV